MTRSSGSRPASSSTSSSRTEPSAWYSPTVPLSRPSAMTQRAPASRSAAISAAHCSGTTGTLSSLAPVSASTVSSPASSLTTAVLPAWVMAPRPLETSSASTPCSVAQSRRAARRPWATASSSRVPPSETVTSAEWHSPTRFLSSGSTYPTPQPTFTTSTSSPAPSSSDASVTRGTPLSRTWVTPLARGLRARGGRSRKSGHSHMGQPPCSPLWTVRRRPGGVAALAGRSPAQPPSQRDLEHPLARRLRSEGGTPVPRHRGEDPVRQRLVVVGGGAAGMSAASAARRLDPSLEVVVLEATGWAAYGLCGLPYLLAGLVARPEDLLAYPASHFRDERGIDLRLHTRVTGLDPGKGTVSFREDGRQRRLGWHRLVVAAGGSPAVPRLPGAEDDAVFTVRT